MKSFSIIFLLSVIICSTIATQFIFTSTFTCSLPRWCLKTEYYEKDFFSDHVFIVGTYMMCPDAPETTIVINGTSSFDGFSGEHHLVVKVMHNCQANNKFKAIVHQLPNVPIEEKVAPINYTINLA